MSCRFAATAATYGIWREHSLYTTQLTLKAAPQGAAGGGIRKAGQNVFSSGAETSKRFCGRGVVPGLA